MLEVGERARTGIQQQAGPTRRHHVAAPGTTGAGPTAVATGHLDRRDRIRWSPAADALRGCSAPLTVDRNTRSVGQK